jgi:hypothetical protein
LPNGLLVRLFHIEVPSPFRYYLVYPPRLAASPKLAALSRVDPGGEIARDAVAPHAHPRRAAASGIEEVTPKGRG